MSATPAAHFRLGDPQPHPDRRPVHRRGAGRAGFPTSPCRSRTTPTSSFRPSSSRHPLRRGAGRDGDPGHPADRERPGRASPTFRPSPPRSPRAPRPPRSSSSWARTSRRPPTTSAPRSTRCAISCRGISTRRWCSGWISTISRSSPMRSRRPQMSESELSWFIDNTSFAHAPGVARRGPGPAHRRRRPRDQRSHRSGAAGRPRPHRRPGQRRARPRPTSTSPGGRAQIGGREQTVRVLGAAVSVDQIRNLSIPAGGGRFVRLSDVADVGDGTAEVRTFALLTAVRWSASR